MDPRKAVVRDGYDALGAAYREWSERIEGDPRAGWIDTLTARLPAGARVLDLGCNDGLPWTRRLAERFDVLGVDLSAERVAEARRHVPSARFLVADLAEVEFPEASFDAVVGLYTLHHLPREEHRAALERVASWVRPGGLLLATLGGGEVEGRVEWLGVPMVFSSYDVATNRRLVAEAGLTLLHDELATIKEPEGEATFLWVLGQRPASAPDSGVTPAVTHKAVAYVVHAAQLLVFTQDEEDPVTQSGLQVPAGTVRPGELPGQAALREAVEETGLAGLTVERYLGRADYDLRPLRDETARRDFFLLRVEQAPPPYTYQPSPEQREHGVVGFSFRWLPLEQGHALAGGFGAMLGAV